MKLALGRVDSCPFEAESIQALKSETLDILTEHGWKLERDSDDRTGIPIDYRYMNLLLRASEDPEVGTGDFASGVRVGPGVRLHRIPPLYPRKKMETGEADGSTKLSGRTERERCSLASELLVFGRTYSQSSGSDGQPRQWRASVAVVGRRGKKDVSKSCCSFVGSATQRGTGWPHYRARSFRRNPWHHSQPPDQDKRSRETPDRRGRTSARSFYSLGNLPWAEEASCPSRILLPPGESANPSSTSHFSTPSRPCQAPTAATRSTCQLQRSLT